jgi:hypothetical protein
MRFTTWSLVTNVFVISTVALLSLIPAANALEITIGPPGAGDAHQPGERAIVAWYVPKPRETMIGI